MFPKIAIDLGTVHTRAFRKRKGVVVNEPSLVLLSAEDHKTLAVGKEAERMTGKTPDSVKLCHPLRDGVIADYRVAEILLKYVIDQSIGAWSPFKPDVLISVPANVSSTERRAVIESALKAGARNAYVAKEPVLAALGAGIEVNEPGGHMVLDVGGGTSDSAIISLGGIVASASIKCAGIEIDRAIVTEIRRRFNLSIGRKTAEAVKCEIAAARTLKKPLKMDVHGRDYVSGLPRTVSVSSNHLTKPIQGVVERIARAARDVLQETPPELAADIVKNGIVLTGASARLRECPEFLSSLVHVDVHPAKDPELSVVNGAGLALSHLDRYKRSINHRTS